MIEEIPGRHYGIALYWMEHRDNTIPKPNTSNRWTPPS